MRRITTIALLGAALLFGACGTPHRAAVVDIDPSEWAGTAEIVVENTDTLSPCDIAVFLRYDEPFADDTLTLRIEVLTPDSLRSREWLRMTMTRPRKPASLRRQAVAEYRKQAILPRGGDYRFVVAPTRPVEGIEAVGVHIKKR